MALQLEQGDRLFAPLHWVLCTFLVISFLFSIPRFKHLVTSIRVNCLEGTIAESSGNPTPGTIKHGKEPHVTIQICAYNEGAVVPETITNACSVDWPKDKLTVQVCDDSTDKNSSLIIERSVKYWKRRGFDVERLTRPNRVGYKAGNLRYNFPKIKGDYVAYLDADHRAERDFLRNTLPYFFDENEKTRSNIALVQTPWAYNNTHQNILTECDAFGLDIHHACEQVGRCTSYRLFGFNGTGGIWRKSAVADAGGFTWETITEDLLLSYRAYMKGYDLVYVRHFPQALEVPADILAHVQQKHRWTKGFLQVFRIYRWILLFSTKIPLLIKFEFFAHVLGPLQPVLFVLSHVLLAHLKGPALLNSGFFGFVVIGSEVANLLTAVLTLATKVSASNGHYQSPGSRLGRLRFYVPKCVLQMGMAVFEAKAVLEGLLSSDATFLTTPKKGAPTKARRVWEDDLAAYLGLAVAVHQIVLVSANDPYGAIESTLVRYVARYSNACFVVGLICVSVSFLLAKYGHAIVRSLQLPRIPNRSLAGLTLTAILAVGQVVAVEGATTLRKPTEPLHDTTLL